jgi:hypothetical protein
MTGKKKFVSKGKFRGSTYVRVNKDAGVTEKEQALSDQRGKSSCVKRNLAALNKKAHDASVNTEIKVGEDNFCKTESNFTHDVAL